MQEEKIKGIESIGHESLEAEVWEVKMKTRDADGRKITCVIQ